jgi:hypothetical protein
VGGDDDDEEYYDDGEDEALEYTGYHDNVNIVQYFIAAMQSAEGKDPVALGTLRAQLEENDRIKLNEYIAEAMSAAATVASK